MADYYWVALPFSFYVREPQFVRPHENVAFRTAACKRCKAEISIGREESAQSLLNRLYAHNCRQPSRPPDPGRTREAGP